MGMATLVGVANGNTGKRSGRSTRRSAGRTGGKAGKTEKYERGTRSYTMSHIRGKDTTIEVLVRSYLFRQGLRFRKNDKRYPGHPDIVLPKYHVIVFVNGCFWHGHEVCLYFFFFIFNTGFWMEKIRRNRERDHEVLHRLAEMGWHTIVIWECELKPAVREKTLESLAFTLNHIYLEDHHIRRYELPEEVPEIDRKSVV